MQSVVAPLPYGLSIQHRAVAWAGKWDGLRNASSPEDQRHKSGSYEEQSSGFGDGLHLINGDVIQHVFEVVCSLVCVNGRAELDTQDAEQICRDMDVGWALTG